MQIKNILISIIVFGLAAYGGVKGYMYYAAKKDIDQIFTAMEYFSGGELRIDYEHIASSIYGPVGIRGLRLRLPRYEEEITIKEFSLYERDLKGDLSKGDLPGRFHFKIDQMTMNTSLITRLQQQAEKIRQTNNIKQDDGMRVLKRLGYAGIYETSNDLVALGYDRLTMTFEMDVQIDVKQRQVVVHYNTVVEDMGTFNLSVHMDGVTNNINDAVLGVKLKEVRFEYIDDSYMDRLMKVYADQRNMELEPFREQLVTAFKTDIEQKQIKLSEDSIKNVQDFLKKPNRLILTMYPFKPVGIESIKHYKPGDVPMLLNLQAHLP